MTNMKTDKQKQEMAVAARITKSLMLVEFVDIPMMFKIEELKSNAIAPTNNIEMVSVKSKIPTNVFISRLTINFEIFTKVLMNFKGSNALTITYLINKNTPVSIASSKIDIQTFEHVSRTESFDKIKRNVFI